MKPVIFVILFCSIIISPEPAFSGETAGSSAENPFPYKPSITTDSALLVSGTSVYALSLYLEAKVQNDVNISDIERLNKNDVNPIDRRFIRYHSEKADKTSDITRDISYVCVSLLAVPQIMSGRWGNTAILGMMYLEVLLLDAGITGCVKSTAGRMRPFMYNDAVSYSRKKRAAEDGSANRSFFSGHTASAFSSAVFAAQVFSDIYPASALGPYVWAGSLLLASATACLRVAGGMHFPSDVIAGAAVGSIIGYVVPWLHKKRDSSVAIYPVVYENIGICAAIRY